MRFFTKIMKDKTKRSKQALQKSPSWRGGMTASEALKTCMRPENELPTLAYEKRRWN